MSLKVDFIENDEENSKFWSAIPKHARVRIKVVIGNNPKEFLQAKKPRDLLIQRNFGRRSLRYVINAMVLMGWGFQPKKCLRCGNTIPFSRYEQYNRYGIYCRTACARNKS